jgi:tetratricopeptide (TPR) repeat protein
MRRKVLVAFLFLICASSAAAGATRGCPASLVSATIPDADQDLFGALPSPDYFDSVSQCMGSQAGPQSDGYAAFPSAEATPSTWLASERALYTKVLSKKNVAVLVVPVQVQGYGLDRIERALMTADLARAVGEGGQYTVADPWLVARALGEGRRRFDPAAVMTLAAALDAQKVIYSYVGHNSRHEFTLTMELYDRSDDPRNISGRKVWHQDWRRLQFTDEQTPFFKFHDLLPSILAALPLEPKPTVVAAADWRAAPIRVDKAPLDLVKGTSEVPGTAAFDLFGAIDPGVGYLAQERLYEHAVVAAVNMTGSHSDRNFFEAYALFGLGRRPTALAALGTEDSARARTLRALLNGDLIGAQQELAHVREGLDRVLLQISVRDLEVYYGRKQSTDPDASASVFGGAVKEWSSLIQLRVASADPWWRFDPLVIKALLDWAFPAEGLDAKTLVGNSVAMRGAPPDDVDADLGNVRHIRHAAEQLEVEPCCAGGALRPTRWDLLGLLEGMSEWRVISSLQREIVQQGLPEEALDELNRYEPLYGGQPEIELERARAAWTVGAKRPADERNSWEKLAWNSAATAAYWSPGENLTSSGAVGILGYPTSTTSLIVEGYGFDYPRRSYWLVPFTMAGSVIPNNPGNAALAALEAQSLAFSMWDIPGGQPARFAEALSAHDNRFRGHPQMSGFPTTLNAGNSAVADDSIQRLKAALKADPEPWQNYLALGQQILQSGGSYAEASNVFVSYPGFHERTPDDPVAVSNHAYEAGSMLFWDGQFALARPFFLMSTGLQTGSNGDMTSMIRLQLMDHDYLAATLTAQARAARYSTPRGLRDYIALLHAFGRHEEAWQVFSQVDAAFEIPQVWVAALVGQRMESTKDLDLRKWLLKPEIRSAKYQALLFAPYYAVLWSTTGRTAPADLGPLVEQIEGEPPGHIGMDGISVLVPHPEDARAFMTLAPSPFRLGRSPRLPPGTPVKSSLAYFADAYAALDAGNYAVASLRFLGMADRYPIEDYPLAFYARAAAHSGDPEALEAYVNGLKADSFDSLLARAFFAAGHKDADTAYIQLRLAFRMRPTVNDDQRPVLTEMQYAQACEWLYQDTKDDRFRTELLMWLKAYEVMQPMQGWAYAMQYTYERPGVTRTAALAMARYLDPISKRINGASVDEVSAANAWFKVNNPFSRRTRNARGSSTSAQNIRRFAPIRVTAEDVMKSS